MGTARSSAGHGRTLRFVGHLAGASPVQGCEQSTGLFSGRPSPFIAGPSAEAMIAPWVIKGAMDGEAFAAYVEKVLVPELTPGTVIRRETDPPDQFLILLIP